MKSSKHMATAKAVDSGPLICIISNLFSDGSGSDLSIIYAEVRFTDFLVEHTIFPPHIPPLHVSLYFMLKCWHVCSLILQGTWQPHNMDCFFLYQNFVSDGIRKQEFLSIN